MDAITKKTCPNCSQFYQIKSSSKPEGLIPLFLPCGHSMCETCIKNIVKFEEPIECKICHRDTEVSAGDMALLKQNELTLFRLFPVNTTMLGELTLQFWEKSAIPQKKDESFYIDLLAIIKSIEDTQGQCMECHTQTSKMCQECATILCEPCFNKSHKNFVIFQNHVLKNIERVTQPNNCKTHKGKPLEYYCKDCTKSVCMDCLVVGGDKSCKNHEVVSLLEVNDGFLEEIIEISPKVNEIYKRLTKTAVDVGNLLLNIETETGASSELTQMLATIEQHFSKLSAAIQKHKQEVFEIIHKLKFSEKKSLQHVKDELTKTIKKAKITINAINLSLEPERAKQANLDVLLQEAKLIIETPWYLSKDETNDPLKVAVNEDLCSLVSDFIHLEGNASSVYKLRATSELGEGVEIPSPPNAPVFPPVLPKDVRQQNKQKIDKSAPKDWIGFYKDVPKYRSKSGSVSSLNSVENDNPRRTPMTSCGDGHQKPIIQQVSPFTDSLPPKHLHEGAQELIYISHIVHPHNFFVQRSCHQDLVKEMLREFRNAASLPKPSVSHVIEGKLYLVYNKADNMWQRCRIVSVNRKEINNPVYHVFCIDFGSIEVVAIDKLRLLPPARMQNPYPLAINCSLANCVPRAGSWSSDDSYLIQNIIDNKQAIIHVRHIHAKSSYSMSLEVDVTTFEYGVSLAHALVFHERARLVNPKLPYPKIVGVMERPKLYMNNSKDFKHNSDEEVFITHIVSPDKFYVRKQHEQKVYEKLCEDLEQEYSLSVNTGTVYMPEVGLVCVVNVEKSRERAEGGAAWARGYVRELPGRGRARVLLPDTGAHLLLHWTALRHIHHKFTTLRALATECHLAGVTPLNKKWSPGSVALLRRFEEQPLTLHVEEARGGSAGVTLYCGAGDDDLVCINQEMIKHKFAVSFGIFMFKKNIDVEDQVKTNKSPLDKPKPRASKRDGFVVLKRQSSKEVNEQELEAKDKGPLRLEATVLHYQSPSLLYMSLVHQNKAFNELYENMQKHYSNKKTLGKAHWNVGDRCCTICNQSQTWRRALIVELEGDNAKVFYSDFACAETVPIASLRELTPEFASIGDAAIKCHLCGVVPAVGEEWPSLTKEYLKELLDAYPRVFITKLGNFKDKSMPVEVWVYHTIQGGALEPNTCEWRCLNKKIIEQGLGIPDKTHQVPVDVTTDNPDDMLSFLNITGSVRDWLQLEPLPTKPLNTNPDLRTTNPESSSPTEFDDERTAGPSDVADVVFVSDWLPPEPLQSKEFTAMPTYIDTQGLVYLHDVSQLDTLELIRKALDVRFKAPDPKAKYAKWSVGEPCVALFYMDNRFYRGKVLEVNQEESSCVIQYVDYGNEEVCKFENLRKSIALHQIPVQAHKCVLSRIRPPGGQWARETLDYLHRSVVEKKCLVKITGEPINDVIPIELMYDKLWINNHLVDFEMAEYTDGSKASVRKFNITNTNKELMAEPIVIESDSGPDFIVEDENDTSTSRSHDSFNFRALDGKDWNDLVNEEDSSIEESYFTYAKNDLKEFPCNITIIDALKTLELTIIHNDETNLLFGELFDTLQRESSERPHLNGIFENKACLALFQEDGLWYRACILQSSDGKVKVRYVDFGNVEVVSVADVREIKKEWLTLPPATVTAALYGIQVNTDLEIGEVAKHYADTFLDKGPFVAEVIDYEGLLPCVELRNEEGELVYENLINKGVFIKCEPKTD